MKCFVLIFCAAKPNGQGNIQAAKIPSVWDKIGPTTGEIFQTETRQQSRKYICVLKKQNKTQAEYAFICFIYVLTIVGVM